MSAEGMYRQPPRRRQDGEELDGAGRGTTGAGRRNGDPERKWAERDPIRIWIEVDRSTMDSANLGLFNLPLDAGKNDYQDKQ